MFLFIDSFAHLPFVCFNSKLQVISNIELCYLVENKRNKKCNKEKIT